MKHTIGLIIFFLQAAFTQGQTDQQIIRTLYDNSLTNGMSYQWLDYLSNQIGGRLSGSENAEKAVQYTKSELEKLGLDKVWLQEVMVPKWERGEPEKAYFEIGKDRIKVNICALGGSVATAEGGLKAGVIEVRGMEALKKLTVQQVQGKIIFFNLPMDPRFIDTFKAYGSCANQRYYGALEAGKLGAAGVIVRSLNLRQDDYPHTGAMTYGELPAGQRIPSAAISTNDADKLSKALDKNPETAFYFNMSCKQFDDVLSYNVIGEITGSSKTGEIIMVGGHLDSWDLGDGSHDDGAGVVQSMEVLRLIKVSGIKPKRTIRVVLFMNEENGLRGGVKYAEEARLKNENHIMAMESDSGGFSPRGFNFECSEEYFSQVNQWRDLFEPYLVHYFKLGGSGADIGPLKREHTVLVGLEPDSQRYFDYHHAAIDTFDGVNKRELELGAATMVSLVYLYDNYGIQKTLLKN